MTIHTRSLGNVAIDDNPKLLRETFYLSDDASGNVPRVTVNQMDSAGNVVWTSDHAISEYSTLTPAQKTSFRSMAIAIRDETRTLDGFTP